MEKVLHTKFGTAKLLNYGYYVITSKKEGYHAKQLHRLIFEDFYGFEIPEGYVIHHKNGNKLDNCILNLQLLSITEHRILHNNENRIVEKAAPLDKIKDKVSKSVSKSKTTTGIYRVSKRNAKNAKQGFVWLYSYSEKGVCKSLTSVDIINLKENVLAKGLEWVILDREKAKKTFGRRLNFL